MLKEAIKKLTLGEDLPFSMAEQAMNSIMNNEASPVQISAYLVALSMKGETIDEITASSKVMREYATKIEYDKDMLEIVGTGGDNSNSFNISTTSAIVLASLGVKVAKHGNRAASSKCGSADVLEALGVKIDIPPEKSLEMLNEIDICFLFAQRYHSAMKHVAPIRNELKIRTIFNILGPLSNPLRANMQLMGVYSENLIEPLAHVLSNLGVRKGMVVYGLDNLDEISLVDVTKVCEFRDGEFKTHILDPEKFGFDFCKKSDLLGGDPAENAKITKSIFEGEKGFKRDAVVINSAAALYIAREDLSLQDAIKEVETAIDTGKTMTKLEEFIKMSNS